MKVRIIPCLDVREGKVVKGVHFKNHIVVGDMIELAKKYCQAGADELVFYDITASPEKRVVERSWVKEIAEHINIPFCVAGGIDSIEEAEIILANGADKISINSPALAQPNLINELAKRFGSQCVVVGIDSLARDNDYFVYQYTGDPSKTSHSGRRTLDWSQEVMQRGAGEIVLNCMNQDGMRNGYDIEQLLKIFDVINIPLIASGGAGCKEHFYELFEKTPINAALAASVFHKDLIDIYDLKLFLHSKKIPVRLC